MLKFKFMAPISILVTSVACSSQINAISKETYLTVTICEAVKLKNKEVILDAYYVSDGYEYSFLLDRERCPGTTAVLYDDVDVVNDKMYDEFDKIPWDDPELNPRILHLKILCTTKEENNQYKFYARQYLQIEK